jgi:glucans biosynthesis protein C
MSTTAPNRLAYIDNIRSTMIFLVVMIHAAVTYSHMGSWYYNAPEAMPPLSSLAFGMGQAFVQAFFMGLLFLLAGYFTPTTYDRKGPVRFVYDRFIRLGLPSLLYIFVIHDTMGHYLLHWHNEGFWSSYRYYVFHGDFIDGTGPMWFAVALLIFSFVYALIRAALPKRPTSKSHGAVPGIFAILAVGAVVGLISFCVRIPLPVGTSFHNFQLCFFPQYIAMFVLGILARRRDWFAAYPTRQGYWLLGGAGIVGTIVWLALVIGGNVLAGNMDAYNGGGHWLNLGISLWEQMFGFSVCVGLVVLFREKFKTDGGFARLLRANSFGIYVFHAPVLVSIGLLMEPLPLPPECKFLILTITGFAATLLLVHCVARRIPLLKRIL